MTFQIWAAFVLVFYVQVIFATQTSELPQIEGEGLARSPENGLAKLGQEIKCLLNGKEPTGIKWFVIKNDDTKTELVTDGDNVKATESDATYRCKIDEEHYADFMVGDAEHEEETVNDLIDFRVDKFEKSYSVVEQEDLKIECKISNRTADLNIKNDIRIKWYKYNKTGDAETYVASIGNCTEDLQHSLNWEEVKVDNEMVNGEPHINLIESDEMLNKLLKIEDANRTTDRRAFKCVAYLTDNRTVCSESAFYVRVRDKYGALWPFLGIVSEVVAVCLIIFICERKRAASSKDDLDDDDDDITKGNSHAARQRSNKTT